VKRIANRIVQVNFPEFNFASLFQQPAQVCDDVPGALIGFPNVGKNLLELITIDGLGAHEQFGRLGIEQDRPSG
jgi:hypothetical protein